MNVTTKNILMLLWGMALPIASMQAASKPSSVPLPSTVSSSTVPLEETRRALEIKRALTEAGVAKDVMPLVCEYDVLTRNVKEDAQMWVNTRTDEYSDSAPLVLPDYCPIAAFLRYERFPNCFAVQLFNDRGIRTAGSNPLTRISVLVYEYDISTGEINHRVRYSQPLGGEVGRRGLPGGKWRIKLADVDKTIKLPSQDPYYELPLTDGNTLCLSAKKGAEEFTYWIKCPVKTSTSSSSPAPSQPQESGYAKRRREVLAQEEKDKNASSSSSSSSNP